MTPEKERVGLSPRPLRVLQIVRAIAATSVVYYHIGRDPRWGTFGVDIFFVLSGFVIAVIAAADRGAAAFFSDRITRITPLYWILTTAMLLLAVVAPHVFTTTTADGLDYLRSILFVPYYKSSG